MAAMATWQQYLNYTPPLAPGIAGQQHCALDGSQLHTSSTNKACFASRQAADSRVLTLLGQTTNGSGNVHRQQ